jgi:hypothetical protein
MITTELRCVNEPCSLAGLPVPVEMERSNGETFAVKDADLNCRECGMELQNE